MAFGVALSKTIQYVRDFEQKNNKQNFMVVSYDIVIVIIAIGFEIEDFWVAFILFIFFLSSIFRINLFEECEVTHQKRSLIR